MKIYFIDIVSQRLQNQCFLSTSKKAKANTGK